jgi:hypothetical protein
VAVYGDVSAVPVINVIIVALGVRAFLSEYASPTFG